MKLIMVLSFEIDDVENTPRILEAIDPPKLPHFAGEVRIAIDPVATHVTSYLDADAS